MDHSTLWQHPTQNSSTAEVAFGVSKAAVAVWPPVAPPATLSGKNPYPGRPAMTCASTARVPSDATRQPQPRRDLQGRSRYYSYDGFTLAKACTVTRMDRVCASVLTYRLDVAK